jgi:16S rRNA (adenine1518-N6/adenine1519-N6)-dimethyltransferase
MSTPHLENTNYHFKSRKARYFPSEGSTLKPKKRLAQVFLKNKAFLSKIIKAGGISSKDTVLEIGPGKGVLTEALLRAKAKVIAIEKDPQLVDFLKEKFKNHKNLTIIEADIRDFLKNKEFSAQYSILNTQYKVLGNIPYYLTSHLLQLLLELKHQPEVIVFMIQKEVAQRIVAKPPKMNLLAVSVQFYSQPEIISYVPKSAFWPQPKVDSSIIKLTPLPVIAIRQLAEKPCPPELQRRRESFFQVVKAGFSHPRKLLMSNLSQSLKISKERLQETFSKLNLSSNTRAQNLSLENWKDLTTHLFA